MASKVVYEVDASVRHDLGKGASRRLRRNKQVPAVVYGGKKEAVSLSLEHKAVMKSLENEAFYSSILTLKVDNEPELVVLKDLQRHSFKHSVLHVDFQRVSKDEKLTMNIPIHFLGGDTAPGVKEGGVVSHIMSDVEVSCLPANLPEFLEVDLAEMQMDDTKHLSDIKLPEGVEIVALTHEDDKPLVSIHMPRIEEEPEEIEEGAPEAPAEVPASAQKAEGEEAKAEGDDKGKKDEDKK